MGGSIKKFWMRRVGNKKLFNTTIMTIRISFTNYVEANSILTKTEKETLHLGLGHSITVAKYVNN